MTEEEEYRQFCEKLEELRDAPRLCRPRQNLTDQILSRIRREPRRYPAPVAVREVAGPLALAGALLAVWFLARAA